MTTAGRPSSHDPRIAAPGEWERSSPASPPVPELDAEFHRLLRFAEAARVSGGGFGSLDDDGRLEPHAPVATFSSSRLTYSFALGAVAGRADDVERVDHGLAALLPGGLLHDDVDGGWFASVLPGDGAARSVVDPTKAAYAHAFVVLAASAAVVAGRPAAGDLLREALDVVEQRFWDDDAGMMRESFSADWTVGEPYRGANANMHSVEAFLAAADALGDDGRIWRERAARIVEHVVHGTARAADWLLPEHYDADYAVLRDYNTADRAHPFRPYGVTPGHLFEWARLCLHLYAAEIADGLEARDMLVADASGLYRTAVEIGWDTTGSGGFVYTTDFDGRPVTTARMHWVHTEAVGAAAVLHQVTGDDAYAADHARWWDFARRHFVDLERGSWHHELDDDLQVFAGTWAGKPDVYHALQATLLPRLAPSPMFALGVRTARAVSRAPRRRADHG